jgi:hypothetical protein
MPHTSSLPENRLADSADLPLSKPLLFLVEGCYDIEFLTVLARQLQLADLRIVDLAELSVSGRILFMPMGGNPHLWTRRFAPLQRRELHLYHSESGVEEQLRYDSAEIVNQRPCCRTFVTEKRSLENYLHPTATETRAADAFAIGTTTCWAPCFARDWYERTPQGTT